MGEETKEERFWHRTFGQAQKRPSALGYLKIRGRRPPLPREGEDKLSSG